MEARYTVLIMGATYGSLLAIKLLLAGHRVTLACLPDEAERINAEGIVVRMPVKGRDGLVTIRSRDIGGELSAATPDAVSPADFDLVALAMQEPQYRAEGPRRLLAATASAGVPCMSIMNMPPLTFLRRLPAIDIDGVRPCYTDPGVWDGFDPALMTLASPDPQAFRPPGEPPNVLQVSLPTNFKVARFPSDDHTAMLRAMEAGIEAVRFDPGDGAVELPVKLRVHESVFVPLAKWAMLLTGNYRCIGDGPARSIREAVHSDLEESRAVYDWVCAVCRALGAAEDDLVPFEKYAAAAQGLAKPSSVARAVDAGMPHVERVDCLVRTVAAARGMHNDRVDAIVDLVDAKLAANRRAA